MLTNISYKKESRKKRHNSSRKRISGTAERPRLAVFRSAKHIYAQIVDDTKGSTLLTISTLSKDIRGDAKEKAKTGDADL